MTLIPASRKDEGLLEEVDQFATDEKYFHLWWLGQSGYLLVWKGKRLLLDPYLSDSLTEKYANSVKPHVRMSERVIDPELFRNISVVSSSHNHTDHLDGSTLVPLIRNNPGLRFICPEANRQFVTERISMPLDFPLGIDEGGSAEVYGFRFYGVPASHNAIERDEQGRCRFLGYIIRFGEWTIYHSGDTLWFEGMEELLHPFHIDLAILPINGNDPGRGVAGNLDAREAAELGKAIGAGLVIPCHYHMFTFNTEDPQVFAREAEKVGQAFLILDHGGHFSSEALGNKRGRSDD